MLTFQFCLFINAQIIIFKIRLLFKIFCLMSTPIKDPGLFTFTHKGSLDTDSMKTGVFIKQSYE